MGNALNMSGRWSLARRYVVITMAMAVSTISRSSTGGDILRGGAANNVPHSPAGRGAGAAQAPSVRANAQDALARSTRAVQAVQSMQTTARQAAVSKSTLIHPGNGVTLPAVPDGLRQGGLWIDPRVASDASLWSGADLPTELKIADRAKVTVKQKSAQAFLNWETFNVGKKTDLHFDQSAGGTSVNQWIAFNQVNDPSGSPTQVLGSISAAGQVYVLNQNGIIFGPESQVNVHTLVASTLPINKNLISRGLLSQGTTTQFLFSSLPQAGEVKFTPPPLPVSGKIGDVWVMPGARLTAPTTESNVGGRIALVGPNVTNQGAISTSDGQTILAAGLQVGFDAHPSSDASLRGLDAYVGAVDASSGSAVNEGLIEALRGSVAMTGKSVRQLGAINSSTSVSLNGRIDLRAEFNSAANTAYDPTKITIPPFLYGGLTGSNTGHVEFGPGSVTRILPEWGSADKVVGTELALKSQITARGNTISLGNQGLIHAPSGKVELATGLWDYTATPPSSSFVRQGGQIHIAEGAMINVAGTTDAKSPLSSNILNVTLRGSELADSPLQRLGLLRNAEVTVDLRKTGTFNGKEWVGTPLADLRGYLGLVERTVDELTVSGGSISLNSGGEVIVQAGATLDVSAGWLRYTGGKVKTTRLLVNGRLIDIADATPDRVYQGIYTGQFVEAHPTWGVNHTYRVPWMDGEHYEHSYLYGANAGQLSLAASAMALDGDLYGKAISGLRQRNNPAKGGSLALDFQVQKLAPGSAVDPLHSPTPPRILFGEKQLATVADFSIDQQTGLAIALPAERVREVVISPSIFENSGGGFAGLSLVNPDGDVLLPNGLSVKLPTKGTLKVEAANIALLGDVRIPSGSISLVAHNISPSVAAELLLSPSTTPLPNADRGLITLGKETSLNVSGLKVNQRTTGSQSFSLSTGAIDGGSVSLKGFNADLAKGSVIDVSGGLAASRSGVSYGKAGSVEIITGQDLNLSGVTGGKLKLGSTLKGYSGLASGGTLSLQAQLIQLGGPLLHPLALELNSSFFDRGGFSTFNLTGLGYQLSDGTMLPAVLVADKFKVEPKVEGWLPVVNGPNGDLALTPYLRPEGYRAPGAINLVGAGVKDNLNNNQLIYRGDVKLGQGASLKTGPLGSLSLSGDTVAVYGSLIAPGGRISLSGASVFPNIADPFVPQTTLYLAPSAKLLAQGAVIDQVDRFGRRVGSVLPGGTINLSGNIVAERGAILNVSGTAGFVDLHPTQRNENGAGVALIAGERLVPYDSGILVPLYQSLSVPTWIESAGGAISLRGAQMLSTDATLLGHSGGTSALGGTLSVSSGKYRIQGSDFNTAETNLIVSQSNTNIPVPQAGGVGQTLRDTTGSVIPGMGYFSVKEFITGGFSSLNLSGNVEFVGDVNIKADSQLRIATGGVIRGNDSVTLRADYAALGQALALPTAPGTVPELFTKTIGGSQTPYYFSPVGGSGTLNITARQIDIGNISIDGFSNITLAAPEGDIRGSGSLQMAGRLILNAGQIYPTSASQLSVFVYNNGTEAGALSIQGGQRRSLPLSGGGRLNFFAQNIEQSGVLRAPFGQIQLGWDGNGSAPMSNPIAGTSSVLPITQSVSLTAKSITSVSGIDPITGRGIVVPYGLRQAGKAWIAPTGEDITASGPPEKLISLSGIGIQTATGAVIDLRGGGELMAYEFSAGIGGSTDILGSSSSFAIWPGYDSSFAASSPFLRSTSIFGSDLGYLNSTLNAGDQIVIGANEQVTAGNYTLLPARYALLPGAFLVSPQAGGAIGSYKKADGSEIISAYRYNTADPTPDGVAQQRWELASGKVVQERANYELAYAGKFFKSAAASLNRDAPRLPLDSGRLLLQAGTRLDLGGSIFASPFAKGKGSVVDISSVSPIIIGSSSEAPSAEGLYLQASQLNDIKADSLLIGGTRQTVGGRAELTTTSSQLTVDSASTPLIAGDLILVAKERLSVSDGSQLISQGSTSPQALIVGKADLAGSGNGLLVRVASGQSFVERQGVQPSVNAELVIGNGVQMTGGSISIDSTNKAILSASAKLTSSSITLGSGAMSLVLDDLGATPIESGMTLSGEALRSIAAQTSTLSLNSYSTFDIRGSGALNIDGSLSINAGTIRGVHQSGQSANLKAQAITLGNRLGAAGNAASINDMLQGSLNLQAETIGLGSGNTWVNGFTALNLDASKGIALQGVGSLHVVGSITGSTPSIYSSTGDAKQSIAASGAVSLAQTSGELNRVQSLGGILGIEGSSLNLGTTISLPSGSFTAKATSGNVNITGQIQVDGRRLTYNDVFRYTDGGEIILASTNGSVIVGNNGRLDLSAHNDGGKAGLLTLSAPQGSIQLAGALYGQAEATGTSGSVNIDVASLDKFSSIGTVLNAGGLNNQRTVRVRTGDVEIDGSQEVSGFRLSADAGSITVSGQVDASGLTGGLIDLNAHRNLTLANGAGLSVAAQQFNNAGKGGSVTLAAGSQVNGIQSANGQLVLASGSVIDLSVGAYVSGSANMPGSSAFNGQFQGKLLLRAPQINSGTDVAISAVESRIQGASAIQVEGYKLYDLTATNGSITSALQGTIKDDGLRFGAASPSILQRLLPGGESNPLASMLVLSPGAEIINRSGDLTLGTTTSTATSDWNLSSYRFGPKLAPGILTMRAAGNLVFLNSLTDGFGGGVGTTTWLDPLLAQNALLPANTQSYSYRLTAGADLSSAQFNASQSPETLSEGKGSLILGKNYGNASFVNGNNAQTSAAISQGNRLQLIRTGSGDIDISAGRDIRLMNVFASIYSAGTQVSSSTSIYGADDFSLPILNGSLNNVSTVLGAQQQIYPVQYAFAGGDVRLAAGQDIARYTLSSTGSLIDDTSRQLPGNWLYRRGYIDPLTGEYGLTGATGGSASISDPTASTTWWIDYSNFFQGIGALGGGNVSLSAGRDIRNVDAVTPTNARTAGKIPGAYPMLELGGGDLSIATGNNILGGTYYVERGQGSFVAGNSITLEGTTVGASTGYNPRSPSAGLLAGLTAPATSSPESWIPTLLLAGKSTIDVKAKNDILLGPVANPFLLPAGIGNKYWYKSYFSTFAPRSAVNVTSLSGDITHRLSVTLPDGTAPAPTLLAWIQTQQVYSASAPVSSKQPWLRLSESSVSAFTTAATVMPATLKSSALSGSINVVGTMNMAPAANGTLEIIASGAINGLNRTGGSQLVNPGSLTYVWGSSSINLSDANPERLPSATAPLAYQRFATLNATTGLQAAANTAQGTATFYTSFDALFAESGSTTGIYGLTQTKQALHAPGVLHANDQAPLRLYALGGDISGLSLYSPKESNILAGQDISDVAFYLQNASQTGTTVVSAARDILPYNPSSPLRSLATAEGNVVGGNPSALVGDLQIAGQGTLELLAGRRLTLGSPLAQADGTGDGISSIGNLRNPYLSTTGADIVLAAGLGTPTQLRDGNINLEDFTLQNVQGGLGSQYLAELGISDFEAKTKEEQARIALQVYFLMLRDAGRGFATVGNYDSGVAASQLLFGQVAASEGSVDLSSRSLKTRSGGNITVLAPNGGVNLGVLAGNGVVPPGLITESGGNISIYSKGDVDVGVLRIFTLRGGNIMIWSAEGDVAAGSSSKTVAAAPPTRVIIDPQSADVATDLAGLSTGGGIGVLATVKNIKPGDVDLVAPQGAIDAGDAGIRSAGNLNIAANTVLNAGNIAVGGTSVGAPSVAVSAPSVSAPPPPPPPAQQTKTTAASTPKEAPKTDAKPITPVAEPDSVFTVKVLGYGGGSASGNQEDDDEKKKREKEATEASQAKDGRSQE